LIRRNKPNLFGFSRSPSWLMPRAAISPELKRKSEFTICKTKITSMGLMRASVSRKAITAPSTILIAMRRVPPPWTEISRPTELRPDVDVFRFMVERFPKGLFFKSAATKKASGGSRALRVFRRLTIPEVHNSDLPVLIAKPNHWNGCVVGTYRFQPLGSRTDPLSHGVQPTILVAS